MPLWERAKQLSRRSVVAAGGSSRVPRRCRSAADSTNRYCSVFEADASPAPSKASNAGHDSSVLVAVVDWTTGLELMYVLRRKPFREEVKHGDKPVKIRSGVRRSRLSSRVLIHKFTLNSWWLRPLMRPLLLPLPQRLPTLMLSNCSPDSRPAITAELALWGALWGRGWNGGFQCLQNPCCMGILYVFRPEFRSATFKIHDFVVQHIQHRRSFPVA